MTGRGQCLNAFTPFYLPRSNIYWSFVQDGYTSSTTFEGFDHWQPPPQAMHRLFITSADTGSNTWVSLPSTADVVHPKQKACRLETMLVSRISKHETTELESLPQWQSSCSAP